MEKRSIGGRRFSEYRANLYMKLTRVKSRRKKRCTLNGTAHTARNKRLEKNQEVNMMTQTREGRKLILEQKSSDINTRQVKAPITHHTEITSPGSRIGSQMAEIKGSPDNLSRSANALEEINRRLLSQRLVWISLEKAVNISKKEIFGSLKESRGNTKGNY